MNKYQKIKEEKFIEACKKGKTDIVELLVANGVDIHNNDDQGFQWACMNGHGGIAKFLVANGVDIHANHNLGFQWALLEWPY